MAQFSTDNPSNPSPWLPSLFGFAALLFLVAGCASELPENDREQLETPEVEVFFNSTGTRPGNQYDLKPSEFLVERIDAADGRIDVAAYGFDKPNIVDALIRAYDRGVNLRFVGSTSHLREDGYQRFLDRHIPMQVGNEFHIMHNKFFIIDQRFVFGGTGNITPTGFNRNNNNWVWMESTPLALDFQAEFDQMFDGRFSTAKQKETEGPAARNTYEIGDTTVEVYFSPQEKGMTRIIEEVNRVKRSIHFQIFAFTKDEVGSAFISKHRELMEKNRRAADDGELPSDWRSQPPQEWKYKVVGLLDRSQVHGNAQYHEAYRLETFDVPMRVDANEASRQPGDYQAGGGRLHTKTMILDAGTEDARVLTGSFNWSSAATVANDEFLLVLHGERIADRYMDTFGSLWKNSREIPTGMCNYLKSAHEKNSDMKCAPDVEPGDVVFSEVHWDGWNGQRDPSDHTGEESERAAVSNDEFIELHNTTDRPIDLSLWTITNESDFIVGFPPGTVIQPGEYYLILDHNTEAFSERRPQRDEQAFQNPDFVLNHANDPRFHRLNLKNSALRLELHKPATEPDDAPIDVAGNGGPPFFGGRVIECTSECDGGFPVYEVKENLSMERKIDDSGAVEDGAEKDAWAACARDKGGENVNKEYRDVVIATPGEPNSE